MLNHEKSFINIISLKLSSYIKNNAHEMKDKQVRHYIGLKLIRDIQMIIPGSFVSYGCYNQLIELINDFVNYK